MADGYSGERKSGANGNSLEFSDYKDYAPGDDLRRVDWNSYGRLDKLYVKMFQEEKQADISFFIDTSVSMRYGGDESSKLWFAKLFAASLAYIGLRNADRVNIVTFDSTINRFKNGMFTQASFGALVDFLDGIEVGGCTRVCNAVSREAMARYFKLGPGISFLISDMFSEDGYQGAVKFLSGQRQDVFVVHVMSRDELDFGFKPDDTEPHERTSSAGRALKLVDSETGKAVDVYMNDESLARYADAVTAFCSEIEGFCKGYGARYILAPSDESIFGLLQGLYTHDRKY